MGRRVSFQVVIVDRASRNSSPVTRVVKPRELNDPQLLQRLESVRKVRPYRNRVGRVRYQPSASGAWPPVVCESRQEALRVMELDRQGDTEWILGQPFWLEEYVNGKRATRHAPDFLRGLRGGGIAFENVRPPSGRTPKFEDKVKLCMAFAKVMGWEYETVGEYDGAAAEVVNYLWQYARVEPRLDVVIAVVEAFRERPTWGLGELRTRVAPGLADYPTIMALIWRGDLTIEMTAPITGSTIVRVGSRWGQ